MKTRPIFLFIALLVLGMLAWRIYSVKNTPIQSRAITPAADSRNDNLGQKPSVQVTAPTKAAVVEQPISPPKSSAPAASGATSSKVHTGLQRAIGPLNADELILTKLRSYTTKSNGQAFLDIKGLENPDTLTIKAYFPLYSLRSGMSLADATNGDLDSVVAFDGRFRSGIYSNNTVVAMAEFTIDRSSGQTVAAPGISPDPGNIDRFLNDVASLPQVTNGSYEVRYLDIRLKGNQTPVLWLKATEQGSSDSIYTLNHPPRNNLKANTLYPVADFLAAFRNTQPTQGAPAN